MELSQVIIAVIAILILSVLISGYLQRRAQLLAERRQRATVQFIAGKTASDVIDSLRGLVVPQDIMLFLFNFSLSKFQQARQIWRQYPRIDDAIERIAIKRDGYKPGSKDKNPIPKEESHIAAVTNRLKKLLSYLKMLHDAAYIPDEQWNRWQQHLQKEILRIEIDGALRLAETATEQGHTGTAKTHVAFVSERLGRAQMLGDAFVQERQQTLEEIIQKLEALQTDDTRPAKQEERPVIRPDERIPLGDTDALFGEKKKW
jgi:hypothetical protein